MKIMTPIRAITLTGLFLTALGSYGETSSTIVESDWIKPNKGHVESKLGARIESVETIPDSKAVNVTISVPTSDKDIEEVMVLGRPESVDMAPVKVEQPAKVQILNSPERSGIVIRLPNLEDFVLRINYSEAPAQP